MMIEIGMATMLVIMAIKSSSSAWRKREGDQFRRLILLDASTGSPELAR
jgi:hypothetical protein